MFLIPESRFHYQNPGEKDSRRKHSETRQDASRKRRYGKAGNDARRSREDPGHGGSPLQSPAADFTSGMVMRGSGIWPPIACRMLFQVGLCRCWSGIVPYVFVSMVLIFQKVFVTHGSFLIFLDICSCTSVFLIY